MHTTNTSGFSSGASIPDASIFSSKLSDHTSTEGKSAKKQPSGPDNNSSKRGFPFWLLILLLLLFTTGVSARSQKLLNAAQILAPGIGIDEIATSGTSGINGVDGIDGDNGSNGKDGRQGSNGEKGQDGSTGSAGVAGANGSAGADGAQGVPGSNDCISGICVSRQTTSPGTQETGSINIDGAILAANLTTSGNASIEGNTTLGNASGDGLTVNAASWTLANATTVNIANSSTSALNIESGLLDLDTSNSRVGIGTASPSNTLSVGGTANFGGHSATGSGATVNGMTSASDAISGISAHNTIGATYETLTNMNSATTMYEALGGVLKLDPGSAPSYGQVAGNNGGVEIVSGNAQNFTGNISGMNGSVIHSGTGIVTSAVGGQSVLLNLSNGNVANGYGVRALGINYNLSATPCVVNVSCLITNYVGVDSSFAINAGTITNYKGLQIQTPTNAGTITNNYGLYIQDQSSVGDTNSYNLYSAGATAKNYFAGLVGIGATPNSTYKLDVNGVIRGTKFSGISGSTTWLSSDGSNTGLFVTDAANPQTGANRAFHVTADGSAIEAFKVTGGAAAQVVALVKGAASQTANLQEWQNSSGTALSVVDENGYLGVGTSDPTAEIEISQSATWLSSMNIRHSGSGKALSLGTTGGATSSWNLENANGLLYFYNTSLSETSLELQDNGNVGIGTNFGSAGAKLHVKEDTDTTVLRLQDSDGTCDLNPESGSLTTTCSSDARLKTNITDAASVLSEINGLHIHDYTVIASGQQTTGLIAQEVINTNPDMVHMGEDGYYKVDSYNPWKVLKGIQELSSSQDNLLMQLTNAIDKTSGDIDATNELLANQGLRIDQLSATLDAYASQLSDHQTRIEALEAEIRALKQN